MHPAATTVSNPVSPRSSSVDIPSSDQHGLLRSGSGSPGFPPQGLGDRGGSGASTRVGCEGQGPVVIGSRPPRSASGSPGKGGRIARYEAMGGSPTFGGTGFVVTRTDWTGREGEQSVVARFPNEVITHFLSFLDPPTLRTVSLVSLRFHTLVNSDHSWRVAFSRYFPSPLPESDEHETAAQSSRDRRYFTSLLPPNANAENLWRSEYTQRTLLLRSLAKGKAHAPDGLSGKRGTPSSGGLEVSYGTWTGHPAISISHLAVSFAPTGVRAVHAALESQVVQASDPTTGRIERRPMPVLEGFEAGVHGPDLRGTQIAHPDYAAAHEMGVDRVMDISEELGWIMGENAPNGLCYVHLYQSPYPGPSNPGIMIHPGPALQTGSHPLVTSVWMAKKRMGGIRETSGGEVGIVIGNSRGVVRIFSIVFGKTRSNVQLIKDFVLCPGVPIVQVKVDDDYLPRRKREQRPWIMVANALGEIYYLRHCPPFTATVDDWRMIPQSARKATATFEQTFPMPANKSAEKLMNRQKDILVELMKMSYYKAMGLWENCGMDWFIEVDWAGGNVVVGRKGIDGYFTGYETNGSETPMKRYHLYTKKKETAAEFVSTIISPAPTPTTNGDHSIFGDISPGATPKAEAPENPLDLALGSPPPPAEEEPVEEGEPEDEWRVSELAFGNKVGFTRITAIALDNSTLARLVPSEGAHLPGHNARLLAIGTNTGSIFIYNLRPSSRHTALELPIRTINTDSPQITALALSSLVLVHGGDDGLVQAWDPLCSTYTPVRTLNNRFTAKARRRLEQQNLHVPLENNQFAARAIILDPDATSLRGVVALGTLLRYWSFSVTAHGDRKKRKKIGGSAHGRPGNPNRTKGDIKAEIESESSYLKREREREKREQMELEMRYGVASGHGALSEEEMLAYATMISQESFEAESSGRGSEGGTATTASTAGTGDKLKTVANIGEETDPDLEMALRLSLQELQVEDRWEAPRSLVPEASGSTSSRAWGSPSVKETSPGPDVDVEEQWPDLRSGGGKGKGRVQREPSASFEDDLEMAIRLSLQEAKG